MVLPVLRDGATRGAGPAGDSQADDRESRRRRELGGRIRPIRTRCRPMDVPRRPSCSGTSSGTSPAEEDRRRRLRRGHIVARVLRLVRLAEFKRKQAAARTEGYRPRLRHRLAYADRCPPDVTIIHRLHGYTDAVPSDRRPAVRRGRARWRESDAGTRATENTPARVPPSASRR